MPLLCLPGLTRNSRDFVALAGHLQARNEVLTAELTAVNQYFLDAKMFDNWGYERLGERFRSESIDEMKHAQKLIDRILFLDGLPNLQKLGSLNIRLRS